MMSLYKYTSAKNGIDILSNSKIRFTQPAAFNDPFDVLPCTEELITNQALTSILLKKYSTPDNANDMIADISLRLYTIIPPEQRGRFEDFKNSIMQVVHDNWQWVTEYMQSEETMNWAKEGMENTFLDIFRYNIGVLSLSRINDDLLMWSHYADSHRGIVIGFNDEHPFFLETDPGRESWSGDVSYIKERPLLHLISDNVDYSKAVKDTFYVKYKLWEYEQEFRVLRSLNNTVEVGKDSCNYPIHLFDLPPGIITSVTFGCRMNGETRGEIINLLSHKPEYQDLNVNQAFADRRIYKLSINKFDISKFNFNYGNN